jgi:hypothetical protein
MEVESAVDLSSASALSMMFTVTAALAFCLVAQGVETAAAADSFQRLL